LLPKQKKKKRSVFSNILIFISVIIAFALVMIPLGFGVIIYFNSPVQPENLPELTADIEGIRKSEDGAYYVDVHRGESSQSVGLRLERAGLIKNRHFWNLLCRWKREHIKTGVYRLEIPVNQLAIHQLLVLGKQILYRVTIPEGATLKKTAGILEEAGICSSEDFFEAARDPAIINSYRIPNLSMEGYLFPDTYLFPSGYPASQIVKAMADNFYGRIEEIDPDVKKLSPEELNEKVIIASIVEREYRVSEEAPLMAGVFYNRLQINMALQSCATVEYIITEIQGKPHPLVILNKDLEIRDPYNTYIRPGLPPGPISVPGIVALRSAIFPEKTDYFYFRLDDPEAGRHYFSKTLDEHINVVQLIPKGQS
jgi:UPF0755 protein